MTIGRRELLVLGGATALGVGCGKSLDLKIPVGATYDEVIAAVLPTDFEFGSFTNHSSMVAETLVAAGKPERAATWVEKYAESLSLSSNGRPLGTAERATALDHYELRSRWVATYEADLESMSPRELLTKEWPKLRGGIVGSLWHGLIRTAHAARALDREDTPVRRKEFARGLAYWAARLPSFSAVPGSRPATGLDVATALSRVRLVPVGERVSGTLEARFSVVTGRSSFTDSVETVDLNAMPGEQAMTELTAAAARIFVNDGTNSIILLHAITGTGAMRLLFPWLDANARIEAVGAAFHALAAVHATQSLKEGMLDAVPAAAASAETLFKRAFTSDDVHDLKLGELVLREFQTERRPELLSALESFMR